MAVTIYLSTLRDRVYLGEIPSLLATALHPPLPLETPCVLSYLAKNDLPLTEADMQALNAGPFAGLPPLNLAKPPTEPEWQEYAEAIAANPLKGWSVEPVWRNPQLEQAILHAEALKDHQKELEKHASRGAVKPKSPTTGIEEPSASGDRLKACYITIPEFEEHAGRYQVAVVLRREFVRRPLVQPLVTALRKLPPNEWVVVSYELASKGAASGTVREHLGMFDEIAQRQSQGYFTLEEAADILCEEHQRLSPARFIELWTNAELTNQQALVRGSDRLSRTPGERVRPWHDLVKVAEVDQWHAARGDEYSLSAAIAQALGGADGSSFVKGDKGATSSKVWTDERKSEARAYREKHGLKKTAVHYGVSQATISKNIPAGKARPKKLGPWEGLGKK